MNYDLIRIGDLCRLVRGSYGKHAADHRRSCETVADIKSAFAGDGRPHFYTPHDLKMEWEQVKHAGEMIRWNQAMLQELYGLVLRWLPEIAPRLRLVGEPAKVNTHDSLDFEALETELRMIEAAAVQPEPDKIPAEWLVDMQPASVELLTELWNAPDRQISVEALFDMIERGGTECTEWHTARKRVQRLNDDLLAIGSRHEAKPIKHGKRVTHVCLVKFG